MKWCFLGVIYQSVFIFNFCCIFMVLAPDLGRRAWLQTLCHGLPATPYHVDRCHPHSHLSALCCPSARTNNAIFLFDIEIYNTTSNYWRQGHHMPSPRCCGTSVIVGRKIWVLGGWNQQPVDVVEVPLLIQGQGLGLSIGCGCK